ncbi:hypothetical protein WAI453_004083 [Rhynchosporium graminicola]
MATFADLPLRLRVSDVPLPSLCASKKRTREASVQDSVQSDSEPDTKRATHEPPGEQTKIEGQETNVPASALLPKAPLSRKQRRKQLRSVSKQSSTRSSETLPASDAPIITHVSEPAMSLPTAEAFKDDGCFVEAATQAIVRLQLLGDDADSKGKDSVGIERKHAMVLLQLLKEVDARSGKDEKKEAIGSKIVVQVEEINVKNGYKDEVGEIAIGSEDGRGIRAQEAEMRKQSVSTRMSVADTLVEEEFLSLWGKFSSSSTDITIRSKRSRSQDEEEDGPVTSKFLKLEDEAASTLVENAEIEHSFVETIRHMLITNNKQQKHTAGSTFNSSPIPKKYLSPPETAIDSSIRNPTTKLQEVLPLPEYGPQPRPLMPRTWIEASTWDMTPPSHGARKTYTNASQLEHSNSVSSSLSSARHQYTPPQLTTLWAVSRYMDQKRATIDEHAKREGLRWQVMKAVERNLDVQKRRESREWPKNWDREVEKDGRYMRKMVTRVEFLMRG